MSAALLTRGLTNDELQRGWTLYGDLNGFGSEADAHPVTRQTATAQALNEIKA